MEAEGLQLVAAKLGISFYDKELLSLASKESGFEKGFFEKPMRDRRGLFLG